MSNVVFNTLNKTFNDISFPFTNIVLGAVLYGTPTTRVAKVGSPTLVRVKFPTAPVLNRISKPVAPTFTRVQ